MENCQQGPSSQGPPSAVSDDKCVCTFRHGQPHPTATMQAPTVTAGTLGRTWGWGAKHIWS